MTPPTGLLLLNKPCGMSSHQAVQHVKALSGAKRAGHTGSLDPLASGLLPICLGEATKFARFFLDADKGYEVDVALGTTTTTGDEEGECLVTRPVPDFSHAELEQVLNRFIGPQTQLPPMYSAVKHQGKPLYRFARQGKTVQRKPRAIVISTLELEAQSPQHLHLKVMCSKGTYIRTLAEDIGEALGCGAHVAALHRCHIHHMTQELAVDFKEIATWSAATWHDKVLPLETVMSGWPQIILDEESCLKLNHGQSLLCFKLPEKDTWVQLLSKNGCFIGMGQVTAPGQLAPRRMMRGGTSTGLASNTSLV